MLEVRNSPSLAELTTLRLGGTALAEILLRTHEDVVHLESRVRALGGEPYVLGRGSNILAAEGTVPVVLIRPLIELKPHIVAEDATHVHVCVGAGVRLPELLRQCAAWGLSGLEGLCGIPGHVGGAVAMNAGSYQCEVCPLLERIRVYILGKGIQEIHKEQIHFGYRHMEIVGEKEKFILLDATFCLTRAKCGEITKSMSLNFFKKKSTQPITAWSAGCIFKNPEGGESAGRLLDLAGFKGRVLGGMAFSPLHANFLINMGTGSSEAAFALIRQAKETVLERFEVALETEVRMLPWPRI